MKFIKNLLGQKEPEGPRWNTKPPGERPAPRRRAEVTEEPVAVVEKKAENPFLDDQFADMELVNDVSPVKDDPYASNTWKYAQESDTRKLKTLHLGSQTAKGSSEDFNPYDTGVFRRGWKD